MNTVIALVFILTGALFLLVSTVFHPAITSYLLRMGEQTSAPPFWNLSIVLNIVRVIFLVTGGFLEVFGILLLLKKLPLQF